MLCGMIIYVIRKLIRLNGMYKEIILKAKLQTLRKNESNIIKCLTDYLIQFYLKDASLNMEIFRKSSRHYTILCKTVHFCGLM